MYYDLITSLPHLPHSEQAEWLPITPLRLQQRLKLLKPAHAEQLARARSLVMWRRERSLATSDAALVNEYAALMDAPLESPLREYVAFRMDQQTLLAALRSKRLQQPVPEEGTSWGAGARVHHIRKHWDDPDFRLTYVFPWLASARDLLAAGDAHGLERLLMDAAWQRLNRFAQRNMFSFEAVFAYVFQWDILQAWLAADAEQATVRFRELIDKVTHVEHN